MADDGSVNVPDEAYRAARRVVNDDPTTVGSEITRFGWDAVADIAVRAAAPFIVAANQPKPARGKCICDRVAEGAVAHTEECVAAYWSQPEPLHEVACPECGTTIRARMADQPGEDLRAMLEKSLTDIDPDLLVDRLGDPSSRHITARLLPTVQAYVDSQVAAARADERAKRVVPAHWVCDSCGDATSNEDRARECCAGGAVGGAYFVKARIRG